MFKQSDFLNNYKVITASKTFVPLTDVSVLLTNIRLYRCKVIIWINFSNEALSKVLQKIRTTLNFKLNRKLICF